jgi:riboflavin biosynthesis pyrimidine reductase
MPDSDKVTELIPVERELPLDGLYLSQGLAQMSAEMQRALVLTTYLTDRNGVIAKADERGHFRVPLETRNASDWRLSQELMAQADVLISGGDYLKSTSAPGKHRQDILHQFEAGGEFEGLGEWRLRAGYEKRSPDLAIVTRKLDFKIPEQVIQGGRRVYIFTTNGMANSERAKALTASGAVVIGSGETGVEGRLMIDYLADEAGARVIVMATGPGVLQLLLAAKRLDFLYITQVQREIRFEDPSSVKTLLSGGQKVQDLKEFRLTHQYLQDNVITADGSLASQLLLRYDRI